MFNSVKRSLGGGGGEGGSRRQSASDLQRIVKDAENIVHKEVDEVKECKLTTTTPRIEAKMRSYRNRAAIITLIIEVILFATGASFWWQSLALFPTFIAVSSVSQEKSKM
jgi:hypothetical protein